jgi:hypothetical protein
MRRVVAAIVTAAAALVAGCESSSNAPRPIPTLEDFPAEFARRYCRRVYDCCRPEDRSVASPGTDEEMCTAGMTEVARENGTLLMSFGGIAYIPLAGRRCLEVLEEGACGDVFDPSGGSLIACQDVFAGTRPLGAACEEGQQCESATCSGVMCIAAPMCGPDRVTDAAQHCGRRVGLGERCSFSAQCPEGAACVANACKMRDALGTPCTFIDDCAGACAPVGDSGVNACRAGFCLGQ